MPFRIAIAASVLIHSVLFVPLYKTFTVTKGNEAAQAVVVDYVNAGEAAQGEQFVKMGRSKNAISGIPSQAKAGAPKAIKIEARELIREQAGLRASQGYINYYQHIRESIRQSLKSHYKNISAKGEVALIFILTSDGALAAIDVDEAKSVRDPSLVRIAIESVKESAPFPPFPKELSVPKISFDLAISFKKE